MREQCDDCVTCVAIYCQKAHVRGIRGDRFRANWCFFNFYAKFGARELLRRNKSSHAPKRTSVSFDELGFCDLST